MASTDKKTNHKKWLAAASMLAMTTALFAAPAHAIVPNDNQTPEDIIDDEEDVTGVGMFFRADGFVCSGTLINPRTVLFAAHCVNDRPASDYGTNVPAAWSFSVDALPGFNNWAVNGATTNPDLFVYNVNQLIYNLQSLQNPQALGFIEADIAISSLDTPAANIPTWALLFSPLPAPDEIDPVTGTGYHVNINGYGATGSGTNGAFLGVDFRRRVAENMLGSLSSIDDRSTFLFGTPSGLPQILYNLDFDDPVRLDDDPTTAPYTFDINIYRDDPLEGEGTTAGGDSGGPLILDAANNDLADEDLVLGVLSGGSRFFTPQPFSAYGTTSFYQPLFLYWDWIAANNPYRYVGAAAGDGAWEDGDHWVTMMDPAYRIIDANGDVVNGIPTTGGNGLDGTDPKFGEQCFEPYGPTGPLLTDCENLVEEETSTPTQQGEFSDNRGRVSIDDLTNGLDASQPAQVDLAVEDIAQDSDGGTPEFSADPLPDPTLANGLPGATGFVPDNVDPDVLAGINARYFDVTLSAAGTTSLSSVVEIDRFTVAGANAGLNVTDGGSLTSLIDINHLAGRVNIGAGGSITTNGDYLLMMGMLSGGGTLTTPFFTNVAGAIAPGNMGTAGTLTIDGNAILSSGSVLLHDVTASGSDLLDITGDVSLGGNVAVNFAAGVPVFGEEYTILTYGGTSSGGFSGSSGFGDGVLFGSFADDGAGTVTLSVDAQRFQDFIPASATSLQQDYATALDEARTTSFSEMSDVFDIVDYLAPGPLLRSFEQIAPGDTLVAGQSSLALGEALSTSVRSRLRDVRRGESGFVTTAQAGSLQLASNDSQTGFQLAASQMAANDETRTYETRNGIGGFLSADFYQGDIETGLPFEEADIEGYVIAGGLDRTLESGVVFGIYANYASSENDASLSSSQADIDGFSGGVYTHLPLVSGGFFDAYVSYGDYTTDTSRTATLPGGTLSANASTDATVWTGGFEIGNEYSFSGGQVRATPSFGFDHIQFNIDEINETGSGIALDIDYRELTSNQLFAGGLVEWDVIKSGGTSLFAGGRAVLDLQPDEDKLTATFAATPNGAPIIVRGAERSDFWFELEAGLDFNLGQGTTGSLSVRPNIGRDGLNQTMIGGALQWTF